MLHNRMCIRHALLVIALSALLVIPVLADIAVSVDGQPVPFAGQKPVLRSGTVLVPLRGVFEKLGASVTYDAPTKRVIALKGDITVVLAIGSDTAFVNGKAQTLLLPALVMTGSTMVPLRFVSEALGAQVKWLPDAQTVQIITAATNAEELPPAGGSGDITGRVTGVFPQLSPQLITLMFNGQNQQIPLSSDVVVLVNMPDGRSVRQKLSDIRVGDQVTVSRGADGKGILISSSYGEAKGTFKSSRLLASGNYLITLDDGSTFELAAQAPVTMADQPVSVADIKPGEQVVIRTNPQTKMAYGMAVVTGEAPNPTPPAAVKITSFSFGPTGFAKLGDTFTATMYGTPGGTATFEVPGVKGAEAVAMTEGPRGTYKGSFRIPEGVSVRDAAVLGSLRIGNVSAPTIQAPGIVTIDSVGPTISGMTPEEGAVVAEGRPLIYATLSDPTSGVQDVTVKLDGIDVTSDSTSTPSFFNYRPASSLVDGAHTVLVTVTDKAGNATEQRVHFNVTKSNSIIKSISVTPAGPYNTGDRITVTITAASGGTAGFSLGDLITDIPAEETSTGKYVGSYTVKSGDTIEKAPLTVVFKPRTGTEVTATAPDSVTIEAGVPGAPTILSPLAGAAMASPVIISGKARPNATVAVELRYSGRMLILPVNGTVASVEVKAGDDGKWATEAIELAKPLGVSKIQYDAAAATVDASGQRSQETIVSFKGK